MSHSIHLSRGVKGVRTGLGISHGAEFARDNMERNNKVISDGDRTMGQVIECAINNTYSASLNQTTPSNYPLPFPHSLALFHVYQTFTFTTAPLHLQTTSLPHSLITSPSDRPISPLVIYQTELNLR